MHNLLPARALLVPENWIPAPNEPLFTPRKIRVVCVGAGFSGLLLAYKHKYEFDLPDSIDLAIYEKNHDIGGTWLENKYSGVACHIPAHIYTFPVEPNPNWSSFYAGGEEIWQYIKDTSDKCGLSERIQRGSDVFTDEADILINGSGILNKWRWPDIKGLQVFKGQLVHSASWIALVGNGSSAIQILPSIQPAAKSVFNFIRSPTWVAANFASEFTPEEELLKLRRDIEHGVNQLFLGLLKESDMEECLKHDPDLCAQLIPTFKFGRRHISPGEGYLEALQESNVRSSFSRIERVTKFGIQTTDGNLIEFDIIVCATGFDVSFTPFWRLVGPDGQALADLWKQQPSAYFGMCAPQLTATVAHGSLLAAMDTTANLILRWCRKILSEHIKRICVRQDVFGEYNVNTQEALKRTVWTGGCRSWFKGGKINGPVTAMYAGSIIHYKEILESFRTEDFDIQYRSPNRFRFMGNGTTQREIKLDNLAYYVK
ncbi:hypothetical protein BJX70DRAFT_406539 [Aspergillus crustosus]